MFSFIKKLDRPDKQALFTCFFAFFCNGTLALMMGSVMPDLKTAYNLSDTTSGLFISAPNWVIEAGLLERVNWSFSLPKRCLLAVL